VIGSLGASGKRDKMIEFIVRNEKEQKIAAFPEFQDAWDYLVMSLESEGDIVKTGDNNESDS
jgi:hypothetical protein